MNFRTTFFLALVLAGLAGTYYISQRAKTTDVVKEQAPPPPAPGTSSISQPVLDDQLDEIVKISCHPRDKQEWVFEKVAGDETAGAAGSTDNWKITSPIEAEAIPWEVRRFATQLTNLKYDVSYNPGDSMTSASAGLEPPEAVVTLTDVNGREATFEIGSDASSSETYVRLAGMEKICVGLGQLSSLIKPKVLDYRNQQLWKFNKDDATRVEITRKENGGETTYEFARDGDQWMIESPVTAKATNKVSEMVRALSSLRVIKWVADRKDKFSIYGLEAPAVVVKVTTRKEIETEDAVADEDGDDSEEEAPSVPEFETEVFELRVSNRSPIGEETKVFIAPTGEPAVGTIMKSQADRFTPDLAKWREMKFTAVNVTGATKIEISSDGSMTTLLKSGRDWRFEEDAAMADGQAIRELLMAVNDLQAVAYVDDIGSDLSTFGLEQPRVQLKLTIPGVEDPERISIGGFTDPNTKRLVYMRRNDVPSVAKIRISDAEKLLRTPRDFIDRTVLNVANTSIKSIALTRGAICGRDEPVRQEFAQSSGAWSMSSPTVAPVHDEDFRKLLSDLATLKAESVVADSGEASAYGLHDPQLTIDVTYLPPKVTKLEKAEDGSEGETTELEPVEIQPSPETVTLQMTQHEGKIYGKRNSQEAIFEIPVEFYRLASQEMRTGRLFDFAKDDVESFTIERGGITHEFRRTDQSWSYASEPDLPLDKDKVDNLMLQLGDIVTTRFVTHTAEELSQFGLHAPLLTASVSVRDRDTLLLRISEDVCQGDVLSSRFAMAGNVAGVFLVPPDVLDRLEVNLSTLEK